jgi:FAD/FMN-containing dehydrogenase
MQPFVADIESFTLLGADGRLRTCSRSENVELFRLAIGGYGLFGIVYSVQIRLQPRRKLARVVEVTTLDARGTGPALVVGRSSTAFPSDMAVSPV